ncbi:hypothetical protein KSS87_019173 [Heliosperma pusillum]|nr:hypothetical protein KSS87_009408 [Heliosperma pusillum]KAH9612620.1 hypothetical protein KSS87_019173 [Heliosperma pusillum]
MMNVIAPHTIECTSVSGCESGWTLYLEHSTSNYSLSYKKRSFGENNYQGKKLTTFDEKQAHYKDVLFNEQEEDEEEDLSMVSDASSGPPHYDHDIHEEEEEEDNDFYYGNNNSNNNGKKRSMRLLYVYEMQCCNNKANDFALDDTASSHVFSSKETGDIRVQEHQGATFERLIDYSSQGYSGGFREKKEQKIAKQKTR